MPFAVKAGAVATPLLFVVTFVQPPKIALAPVPGAVIVTLTPLTGLLPASFPVAGIVIANAVLIAALCGVPAVAVMLATAPAEFVRLKLAGVLTPDTLAVTV